MRSLRLGLTRPLIRPDGGPYRVPHLSLRPSSGRPRLWAAAWVATHQILQRSDRPYPVARRCGRGNGARDSDRSQRRFAAESSPPSDPRHDVIALQIGYAAAVCTLGTRQRPLHAPPIRAPRSLAVWRCCSQRPLCRRDGTDANQAGTQDHRACSMSRAVPNRSPNTSRFMCGDRRGGSSLSKYVCGSSETRAGSGERYFASGRSHRRSLWPFGVMP